MNKDQAQGQWDVVKGKAKKIWGELTDDDLKQADGSLDKLYGTIQQHFGDTKEKILEKISQTHM